MLGDDADLDGLLGRVCGESPASERSPNLGAPQVYPPRSALAALTPRSIRARIMPFSSFEKNGHHLAHGCAHQVERVILWHDAVGIAMLLRGDDEGTVSPERTQCRFLSG